MRLTVLLHCPQMIRTIWLAFLTLLLTSPLAALQNGQIYLLKGESGKYLSAADMHQILNLSPNTAGWEQWQFRDLGGGDNRFVSFHGTVLASTYPDKAFHAPSG